jgi:hypothetical protein
MGFAQNTYSNHSPCHPRSLAHHQTKGKQHAITHTRSPNMKKRAGDPRNPRTLPVHIDIVGVGYLARIPGNGIENQGNYWLHDFHGNKAHYPIVPSPQAIAALPPQKAPRGKDRPRHHGRDQ